MNGRTSSQDYFQTKMGGQINGRTNANFERTETGKAKSDFLTNSNGHNFTSERADGTVFSWRKSGVKKIICLFKIQFNNSKYIYLTSHAVSINSSHLTDPTLRILSFRVNREKQEWILYSCFFCHTRNSQGENQI